MQQGDTDKILIFATNKNLHLLAEAESIYVDGTFEVCPRLFTKYSQLMLLSKANSFLLCMVCNLGSQEKYIIDFLCLKADALSHYSIATGRRITQS